MRETIAWSYDLLTVNEQQLFRSLAIFDGGCSLPAIEEVCASTDGPPDLLDGVESLQRTSLLRQEETVADVEPRFRMLETIREYGLERLAASGAEDELTTAARRLLPVVRRGGRPRLLQPGDRVLAGPGGVRPRQPPDSVALVHRAQGRRQGSAPGGRAVVVLVRPRARDRGPRNCWRLCWPCPRRPPRRRPERKHCSAPASWH